MNTKYLILAIVLFGVAGFIAYRTWFKKKEAPSKASNPYKNLNFNNVQFTMVEGNEVETYGWKEFVDKYYAAQGSLASEKVDYLIRNTLLASVKWMNNIKAIADQRANPLAKQVVQYAISYAVAQKQIVPREGLDAPVLKTITLDSPPKPR